MIGALFVENQVVGHALGRTRSGVSSLSNPTPLANPPLAPNVDPRLPYS